MITDELIDFIHEQRKRGKAKAEIVSLLSRAGWHQLDIEEAFSETDRKRRTTQTLPPVDVLVGEALALYQTEYKRLSGILFIAFLMRIGSFGLAFAGLIFIGLFGVIVNTSPAWLIVVLLLLLGGLLLFVGSWSDIALLTSISQKTRVWESYRKTRLQIFPFLWLTILSSLATLGGMFLLIIPGIIISVWLLFIQFIYINEGKSGVAALYQSREYVRGRWGEVAGKFIVMPIVLGAISILFYVGISLTDFLGSHKLLFNGLFSILAYLFSTLIVPAFAGAYTYTLYKHVKRQNILPRGTTKRSKWLLGGSLAAGFAILFLIVGIIYGAIVTLKSGKMLTEILPYQTSRETLTLVQADLATYYNRHGLYPDYLVQVLPAAGQADRNAISQGMFLYTTLDGGQNYKLCLQREQSVCLVSHQPVKTKSRQLQ